MQSNFSTLCRGISSRRRAGQGNHDQVPGSLRTVRAHHERQRACQAAPPLHRRDCGYGGKDADFWNATSRSRPEGDTTLQDIELSAREMRIGDNRLCLHTLSDAEDLPGKVATDTRYEKLSTDRWTADCRSPPRWASALLQPYLQPVCADRRQRGNLAEVREVRP